LVINMKKRALSFLLILFIFLLCAPVMLSGCETGKGNPPESSERESSAEGSVPDEELYNDKVKPIIRLDPAEREIRINIGGEYDLLRGVTGSDNLEGEITDRVQIDDGGYDPGVPGKYTVVYSLSDTAGNKARTVMKTITVVDNIVISPPPLFSGDIQGEKLNPNPPAFFGGAWYYKVVSSKDKWVGIEGIVTLPEVTLTRYNGEYDPGLDIDPAGVNLDNPSVYMGGNASGESDVGLSLSKALIDIPSQTLSKGSIAFRPFWRYITSENKDVGGYDVHGGEYAVSCNGNNCIANYHWRYTEYYYLPGDTLRIIIYIPEPNKMQLQIEVIEKSTLPSSVEIRERYGWKDPENFKSPIFQSPGHGTGINAEYKRVNAIDQVKNEGGTAIATDSVIKNAVWRETCLYREINGILYRVPMGESRRGVLAAPDKTRFTVSYDGVDKDLGGEVITIHPGYSD